MYTTTSIYKFIYVVCIPKFQSTVKQFSLDTNFGLIQKYNINFIKIIYSMAPAKLKLTHNYGSSVIMKCRLLHTVDLDYSAR